MTGNVHNSAMKPGGLPGGASAAYPAAITAGQTLAEANTRFGKKLAAETLGRSMQRYPAEAAGKTEHEQLVEQAQKWVGITFFGSMLKQMRNSPFKSEIFDGGRGGEAFGSMFDQKIAERMSRGSGSKLVNAIVKKIEAKKAYAKQGINGAGAGGAGFPGAGFPGAGLPGAGGAAGGGNGGGAGADLRGYGRQFKKFSPIPKVNVNVPANLRA